MYVDHNDFKSDSWWHQKRACICHGPWVPTTSSPVPNSPWFIITFLILICSSCVQQGNAFSSESCSFQHLCSQSRLGLGLRHWQRQEIKVTPQKLTKMAFSKWWFQIYQKNMVFGRFLGVGLSRPKMSFHAQKCPFTVYSRSFTVYSRLPFFRNLVVYLCLFWYGSELLWVDLSWIYWYVHGHLAVNPRCNLFSIHHELDRCAGLQCLPDFLFCSNFWWKNHRNPTWVTVWLNHLLVKRWKR